MPKATTSAAATNALGVRYVVDGPAGIKSKLNEIIRCFDYLFPRQSADIISEVTPQGAVYRLRTSQTTTRTGVSGLWIPGQVPGEAKITVGNPGDVENIIPTIGVTLLTADPAPQLTVVTGDVYFECTMDAAGTFTAVEIKNAASMPSDTTTLRYRRLYALTVTGSGASTVVKITAQPVTTSVSHKLCGGLSTWGQA